MGKRLESYAAKEIARHRMQAKEAAKMPHSITVVTQKAVDQNEMLAAWQKAAELDGNPYPEGVTQAVPDGWMAFEMTDGYRLVRGRDGQSLQGSANPMLWAKQILDFEFAEGAEWKPEQIAAMNAMQSKDYTPAQVDAFAAALSVPLEPLYGAGTSGGGHSADTGKVVVVGVDIASGPDWTGYRLSSSTPAADILVLDEMKEVGFRVAIKMQPRSPLLVETIEAIYRAMVAIAPVKPTWDELIQLCEERDGLVRVMAGANQMMEAKGVEIETLRHALLHILGDLPSPMEDPHERCRKTAANALGYQDPDPMELAGREVPTYYNIGWDERRPVTQGVVDNMERAILKLSEERDETRKVKDAEITMLRQALAMKDARIAQLDTRLALTPVAFEDFDDAPEKPEHNPFRDFGRDPRRMGP